MSLPEYGETLRPTYAVPEPSTEPEARALADARPGAAAGRTSTTIAEDDEHRWQASPQARFERLLRETQVPIGLLSNGTHLRLVYAPRGETSGHLTFPVAAMTEVAGRPIFAALHMLLSAERALHAPAAKQRLPPSSPTAASTRTWSRPSSPSRCWRPCTSCCAASRRADDQREGRAAPRGARRRARTTSTPGCSRSSCGSSSSSTPRTAGCFRATRSTSNYYSVTGLFERLRDDAGRTPTRWTSATAPGRSS